MKHLVLIIVLLFSTTAYSQEQTATKEDRLAASTASMIASTLVKCQGSIGFIKELYTTFQAVGIISKIDVKKTVAIVDGLKTDFMRIEDNHIAFLNSVMMKAGVGEQQLHAQGQEEFIIYKNASRDKYYTLNDQGKIAFILTTMKHIQICTSSADNLVKVYFPEFNVGKEKD